MDKNETNKMWLCENDIKEFCNFCDVMVNDSDDKTSLNVFIDYIKVNDESQKINSGIQKSNEQWRNAVNLE